MKMPEKSKSMQVLEYYHIVSQKECIINFLLDLVPKADFID